jgi:hypothetical protein
MLRLCDLPWMPSSGGNWGTLAYVNVDGNCKLSVNRWNDGSRYRILVMRFDNDWGAHRIVKTYDCDPLEAQCVLNHYLEGNDDRRPSE